MPRGGGVTTAQNPVPTTNLDRTVSSRDVTALTKPHATGIPIDDRTFFLNIFIFSNSDIPVTALVGNAPKGGMGQDATFKGLPLDFHHRLLIRRTMEPLSSGTAGAIHRIPATLDPQTSTFSR